MAAFWNENVLEGGGLHHTVRGLYVSHPTAADSNRVAASPAQENFKTMRSLLKSVVWLGAAGPAGFLSLALMTGGEAVAEEARAYVCKFEQGASQTYSGHAFKSAPAELLQLNIVDIDLDKRTAALSSKGGKGPLNVVRAIGANHFLEVVTEGYLNITTVYSLDSQRKAYPAVHSRHVGLLGEPLVAQYVGYCTADGPTGKGGK